MEFKKLVFWTGCFPFILLFWIIVAIILGEYLGSKLSLAAIFANGLF